MMKNKSEIKRDEFINLLSKIKGQKITDVLAGGGSNGTFFITFGENDYMLSCNCAWRFIHMNQIITGWTEPDTIGAPLNKNLLHLNNDVVKDFQISMYNDISILFESGKVIEIFCDITPASEFSDFNWDFTLINANKTYSISKYQTIILEPYDPELNY